MQRLTDHRLVRLRRAVFGCCAAAMLILLLSAPAAAAKPEKVVALHVEGPQAQLQRQQILKVLPEDSVTVLAERQFNIALARAGVRGYLGPAITSPQMRPNLLKVVRRALSSAGADAALLARIRGTPQGLQMHLLWVEPEGDPLVDTAVLLIGSRTEQRRSIKEVLAPALEELAPEPEKEEAKPRPEDEDGDRRGHDDDDDDDDDDDGGGGEKFESGKPGYHLFELSVGLEFGGRFFAYTESEANTPNLRPYDVFGVPGINLGAEIYPAATLRVPVISDLGLTVTYMHAFGLTSQTGDGELFGTSFNRLAAGLRYRQRLTEGDSPVLLGLSGSYGFTNFTFEAEDERAEAIADEIASVEYEYLRVGLDTYIPIGRVAIMAAAGYLGPLSAGEVYERFDSEDQPRPDSTIGAIDLRIGFRVMLGAGFATQAGFEYYRFFYSFAPEPGDAYVAGGALDELVALRLGAAFIY